MKRILFLLAFLLVWASAAMAQKQDQQPQQNDNVEVIIIQMEIIEIQLNGESIFIFMEGCGCDSDEVIQKLNEEDLEVLRKAALIYDALPVESARPFTDLEKPEVLIQILDKVTEEQWLEIERLLQEEENENS